ASGVLTLLLYGPPVNERQLSWERGHCDLPEPRVFGVARSPEARQPPALMAVQRRFFRCRRLTRRGFGRLPGRLLNPFHFCFRRAPPHAAPAPIFFQNSLRNSLTEGIWWHNRIRLPRLTHWGFGRLPGRLLNPLHFSFRQASPHGAPVPIFFQNSLRNSLTEGIGDTIEFSGEAQQVIEGSRREGGIETLVERVIPLIQKLPSAFLFADGGRGPLLDLFGGVFAI